MKILCGIIMVVASFMLAESLVCRKCSASLLGYCINENNETCTGNTSVCFTARTTFSAITNFVGFNTQGCQVGTTGCNATTNGTFAGATYETKTTCCETDKCNPVTLSSASTPKMTFNAVIGATVLATVLGSVL